jgi:hypothetical protein
LRTGSPADIVVLEPDLSVAVTIVAGAAVFDPAGHLGATTPAAGAAEPVETGDG